MPRDISSVKLHRLNRLMGMLYAGNPVPKNVIVDTMGYTTSRTFERDLAFLREAYDVEIAYDRARGGYVLEGRGSFILNFTLTEREVLGLVSGLCMAAHFLPHLQKDTESLWGKMRSALPESLLEKGETLGNASVISLPVSMMDPRTFDMILHAINIRQSLRFSYASPYSGEEPKLRKVSPWGVFFQSHAWYLWGSHPKLPRGATYRISRILSPHPWPEEPYHEPPEETSLHKHASSGWYGYTGDAAIPVEIEIAPPLGDTVQETTWHPTQHFRKTEEGKVIMTAEVPDLGAVARWIMASAPYAEAKAPRELVEKMEELAREMLRKHGHGSSNS